MGMHIHACKHTNSVIHIPAACFDAIPLTDSWWQQCADKCSNEVEKKMTAGKQQTSILAL